MKMIAGEFFSASSKAFLKLLPLSPAIQTVDQEEHGRFVRDRTRHERLASTGWTKQKDTARGLNTDRLEELWMTQWQFHELTDLCHLFATPTNVVVSHVGQCCCCHYRHRRRAEDPHQGEDVVARDWDLLHSALFPELSSEVARQQSIDQVCRNGQKNSRRKDRLRLRFLWSQNGCRSIVWTGLGCDTTRKLLWATLFIWLRPSSSLKRSILVRMRSQTNGDRHIC